jgi:hypothetical protein
MEEILYWILTEEFFGLQVVECLKAIEEEMTIVHEKMSIGVGPRNVGGPIHFFCAVILIDEMVKKAEKFVLIDDIQHCVKRFPWVYIQ